MKLEILKVPNPLLRQKSKPVTKIDKKIKKLSSAMIQLIEEGTEGKPIGVGLSAIQIGKPIRLFVAFNPETERYQVFINPTITKKSSKLIKGLPDKENKYEGCLSVPGIIGLVKRHSWIVLGYQDIEGKSKIEKYTGFFSAIIQHENDHLDGILLVDRLLEQKEKIYQIQKTDEGNKLIEIEIN